MIEVIITLERRKSGHRTSNIHDTWDHEERCQGVEGKGAGEGRAGEEEAGGAAVSGQLFWQGRQKNTSHSDLISFGQLV